MSESITSIIRNFLDDLSVDVSEERAVQYVVRELHLGRRLSAVLDDPYVKNRLDEERLAHILENQDVIAAVEDELSRAFKEKDFKFAE